jgi:acetyl-CoA carboxylase carboxyltransferase component
MAKEFRIPLVNLIDGAGANVGSALTTKYKRLPGKDGFERCVELLGLVPVASAVLGSAAGGPAGRAVLSHFTVMVKQSSHLFAAGPPVVERALSTKLSKEDLGGWEIAAAESGSIDNVANTESEALDQVKRFLSYMPQNVWDLAPFEITNDPIERREEELLNIVPKNRLRSYNMKRIIELIVDVDSFFEIQPLYGIAVIVGFARIGGFPLELLRIIQK